MTTKNTIASQARLNLPQFVQSDYGTFSSFIEHYFTWLEQQDNFLYALNNFAYNTDLSNQVDVYVDKLLADLGYTLNKRVAVDKRVLGHLLANFYRSRGTEAAYRYLYRALFNVNTTIRYPRERLFTTSDSDYASKKYVYTTAGIFDNFEFQQHIQKPHLFDFVVTGNFSKTTQIVEEVSPQYFRGVPRLKIVIAQGNEEEFFLSDRLTFYDSAGLAFNEYPLSIARIELVNGGSGYKPNERIYVSESAIQGFCTIESVSDEGAIRSFVYLEPFVGVTKNSQVYFEDTQGSGAEFKVTQSTVFESPKRYSTPSKFLGNPAVIHDSDYFQQFSYDLSSRVTSDNIKWVTDDLLHPTGYVRFHSYELYDLIDVSWLFAGVDTEIDYVSIIELNAGYIDVTYDSTFIMYDLLYHMRYSIDNVNLGAIGEINPITLYQVWGQEPMYYVNNDLMLMMSLQSDNTTIITKNLFDFDRHLYYVSGGIIPSGSDATFKFSTPMKMGYSAISNGITATSLVIDRFASIASDLYSGQVSEATLAPDP